MTRFHRPLTLVAALTSLAAAAAPSPVFRQASFRERDTTAANDRVGNGGFAYVCRGADHRITEARLLDLWEAQELQTWRKNDPLETQIEDALGKMTSASPNAQSFVRNNLKLLRGSMVFVDRALSMTEDAFPPYIPAAGCAYEQVARYEPVLTETGKRGLRIDREIYESPLFSESDRAALFIHEAVYLADRRGNDATNSQRSRMIVAHLFSDSKMPDAVRLAIAALTGISIRWSEDGNRTKDFFAVPNPTAIAVETRFWSLDGADDGYGKLTEAQMKRLYRCSYLTFNQSGHYDTGWLSLKELLGNDYSGDKPKGKRLIGTLVATEFEAGGEGSDGAATANSLQIVCEAKDPSGTIKKVAFESSTRFADSKCLEISDDGSISTATGSFCDVRLKTNGIDDYGFGGSPIEIARRAD